MNENGFYKMKDEVFNRPISRIGLLFAKCVQLGDADCFHKCNHTLLNITNFLIVDDHTPIKRLSKDTGRVNVVPMGGEKVKGFMNVTRFVDVPLICFN